MKEAVLEYLKENYNGTESDCAEAAEAMEQYMVEQYIPDVVGLFNLSAK